MQILIAPLKSTKSTSRIVFNLLMPYIFTIAIIKNTLLSKFNWSLITKRSTFFESSSTSSLIWD